MIVGYARVSTEDQSLDMQIDALKAAGCEKIFFESVSTRRHQPELEAALKFVRKDDVLVFWKLDRLGRSLKELVLLMDDLDTRGVLIRCLTGHAIDTTTPQGRMLFGMVAVFAEFERGLNSERTKAGLATAAARGRLGGRPKALDPLADPVKFAVAEALMADPNMPPAEITKKLGISKATLYQYFPGGKTAVMRAKAAQEPKK